MTTAHLSTGPHHGLLCLPMNTIDALFATSRTNQEPPSHLLVKAAQFVGHNSNAGTKTDGGGERSSNELTPATTHCWNNNPPCAFSCQLVSRDYRSRKQQQHQDSATTTTTPTAAATSSSVLFNSFIDTSVVLLKDGAELGAAASVSSNFSCFFDEDDDDDSGCDPLAHPVSRVLAPNLLQSFIDLPFAVDAVVPVYATTTAKVAQRRRSLRTLLPLEQCSVVKADAAPRSDLLVLVHRLAEQNGSTTSTTAVSSSSKLFRLIRLRFAVPLALVQQQQNQQQERVFASRVTLSMCNNVSSLSSTQQRHQPPHEEAKSVLVEGLINTLCVCSGGQATTVLFSSSSSSSASSADNDDNGSNVVVAYTVQGIEGVAASSSLANKTSTMTTTTMRAVDVVGPDTKIVVNHHHHHHHQHRRASPSPSASLEESRRHMDPHQQQQKSKRDISAEAKMFPFFDITDAEGKNRNSCVLPSFASLTNRFQTSSYTHHDDHCCNDNAAVAVTRMMTAPPSPPVGVLVTGPAGSGKSRLVQELVDATSSTARHAVSCGDASAVIAQMKRLAVASSCAKEEDNNKTQQSQQHQKRQRCCWLILDPAEDFFRDDNSNSSDGADGSSSSMSSAATKFLSMWSAERARRSSSSDPSSSSSWSNVTLVCVLSSSNEHLVSDAFHRHMFTSTSIRLQLPSQGQRFRIMKFFLQSVFETEFPSVRFFEEKSSCGGSRSCGVDPDPEVASSSMTAMGKRTTTRTLHEQRQVKLRDALRAIAEKTNGYSMWDLSSFTTSLLADITSRHNDDNTNTSFDRLLVATVEHAASPSTRLPAPTTRVAQQSVKKSGGQQQQQPSQGGKLVVHELHHGDDEQQQQTQNHQQQTQNHQQQTQNYQKNSTATSNSTWSGGDVAGLAKVKEEIRRALLWPIANPAKARRFGIDRLPGLMLHGPPGCAKTSLARAICAEGKFGAFFHLDCASVLSAFVGEAERTIRDVFAQARAQAPAVIFFDEIESLGGRRRSSGGGSSSSSADIGVRLLATLLTEMDGINDDASSSGNNRRDEKPTARSGKQQGVCNPGEQDDDDDGDEGASSFGVCVIGATNLLHLVDGALLRPGRFDLLLNVTLPDGDDREQILEQCLRKSNSSNNNSSKNGKSAESEKQQQDNSISADVSFLAAISQGMSGAAITGAWRDGVVNAVVKNRGGGGGSRTLGKSDNCGGIILFGDGDDDDIATTASGVLNVTNDVAAALRAVKR